MKRIKVFIGSLLGCGAITMLLSCSNDSESIGMYSDREFHDRVVQLQNKYNSSLKIDESRLCKNEETLININDIMRTIENSSFDYELIISEDGGLIAMPILSTASTRSYGSEATTVSYTLSHGLLPCSIVVSGENKFFEIKTNNTNYKLVNVSCGGRVTQDFCIFSGDIKIRPSGEENYTTYTVDCYKNYYRDVFNVVKKD